jgi:uncharacterized protein YaiE (UPF0345 family)
MGTGDFMNGTRRAFKAALTNLPGAFNFRPVFSNESGDYARSTRRSIVKKHLISSLVVFAAFSLSAMATSLPYVSSSTAPINFVPPFGTGDQLQMQGDSGMVTVNSGTTKTNLVNIAAYTVGDSFACAQELDSCPFTGTLPIVVTYNLTFDGVTHSLSQNGLMSISLAFDEVTTSTGAPVQFDTVDGSWNVNLDAFDSGQITAAGGPFLINANADFSPIPSTVPPTPTPEPSSFLLLGAGFSGLAALKFRNCRP